MSLPPDFIHELKQRFAGGVHLNAASRVLYSADASIYQIEPLGVAIPRTQDDPPTTAACLLKDVSEYTIIYITGEYAVWMCESVRSTFPLSATSINSLSGPLQFRGGDASAYLAKARNFKRR